MGAEQLLSAAGHGEAAIQEAVDAIVRAAQSSVPKPSGVTANAPVEIPEPSEPEPEEAVEEDTGRRALRRAPPLPPRPRTTSGRTTTRRAARRLFGTEACRRSSVLRLVALMIFIALVAVAVWLADLRLAVALPLVALAWLIAAAIEYLAWHSARGPVAVVEAGGAHASNRRPRGRCGARAGADDVRRPPVEQTIVAPAPPASPNPSPRRRLSSSSPSRRRSLEPEPEPEPNRTRSPSPPSRSPRGIRACAGTRAGPGT